MGDPVYQKEDGLWYFADETWSNEYGPFETEKLAREALEKYVAENLS